MQHQRREASSGAPQLLAHLTMVLRRDGVRSVLSLLNQRTRHRYTGAYVFLPPILRSVCLVDRENPGVTLAEDTLLTDTYCSIVGQQGRHFRTADSTTDTRLTAHPARLKVRAYHAEPLLDSTGKCFGSLCHWDTRPRVLPREEATLLGELAPMIAQQVLELRRINPRDLRLRSQR